MIIYAALCVKNEGDILKDSLTQALKWADRIFALDNGSDDDTREILRRFGERVVFLGSITAEFREGLKSIPFNWVNSSFTIPRADWWCVMDADEVYQDDPRTFLSCVPKRFGRVCTNTVEFIGLSQGAPALTAQSYSHYIPLDWSETRFYRNAGSLHWRNYADNGPSGAGATFPKRIRTFHFPFRSDQQISKRLATRKRNRVDSGIPWTNAKFESEEALKASYMQDRRFVLGSEIRFGATASNFLASPRQRGGSLAKQLLYAVGFYR